MTPGKPINEADGAAGTRCGVPHDGVLSGSLDLQPARSSDLGDRVNNPVGTHAESFNQSVEDQPLGIREEHNSVVLEAAVFHRVAEDQPLESRAKSIRQIPK